MRPPSLRISAARKVHAPRSDRPRLGQMLVDGGDISSGDQLRVAAMQGRVEARFGDILVAHGLIGKDQLYETIDRQYGTQTADFDLAPPDIRLIDAIGVEACLARGLLPWGRLEGEVLVATARPEQFADQQEHTGHKEYPGE